MKATVDGVTYEGTEDEIRRIVENPPAGPVVNIRVQRAPSPTPFVARRLPAQLGRLAESHVLGGMGLTKIFYFRP